MGSILLVRHGQSLWNLQNRFTGWVDVDLSEKGLEEAKSAGGIVKSLKTNWAKAHTSRLLRAQRTLQIIQDEAQLDLPCWRDSALNERHYGELQGKNKDECREEFGEEQVHIWRRSFDVPPPGGECLADTAKRCLPYFKEYVLKPASEGENQIVSAHGNSLRAIIMFLEKMTADEILKFEISTGIPYLYEIGSDSKMTNKKVFS